MSDNTIRTSEVGVVEGIEITKEIYEDVYGDSRFRENKKQDVTIIRSKDYPSVKTEIRFEAGETVFDVSETDATIRSRIASRVGSSSGHSVSTGAPKQSEDNGDQTGSHYGMSRDEIDDQTGADINSNTENRPNPDHHSPAVLHLTVHEDDTVTYEREDTGESGNFELGMMVLAHNSAGIAELEMLVTGEDADTLDLMEVLEDAEEILE